MVWLGPVALSKCSRSPQSHILGRILYEGIASIQECVSFILLSHSTDKRENQKP